MNFSHGGDIFAFAKELNCSPKEIIDLSSNINFIKPEVEIDLNSIDISFYPDYQELKERVAKNYSVTSENIELFNGATSAIYSLLRYLREFTDKINLYAPIYLEYKRCAILNSYSLNLINRFNNLKGNIEQNSVVIFTNPSTPDGKFYDLESLIKKWIAKDSYIIIDESFLDFTEFKSATWFLDYKRLYIIKSMTKFYASAGARVGAVISNPKNIREIREREPIWKISQFDQEYMKSALKDRSFPKRAREENLKNRLELERVLEKFDFIEKIYSSDVNFLLLKLKGIEAQEFQEALKPYRVLIRDCSNFDFLDNKYIRVAIKSRESILKLEEALCEIFS